METETRIPVPVLIRPGCVQLWTPKELGAFYEGIDIEASWQMTLGALQDFEDCPPGQCEAMCVCEATCE